MKSNNKKEILQKFLLQVESLKWFKEITVFKEAYSTIHNKRKVFFSLSKTNGEETNYILKIGDIYFESVEYAPIDLKNTIEKTNPKRKEKSRVIIVKNENNQGSKKKKKEKVEEILTEEEKIAREEKRRKKEEKKKRKQECLIQEEKKRQQEEQKRKDLMENLFDINLYKKVYLKSSILELNVCEECGGELKLEHKGIFDEERKIHQIQYKKCDLCNTAYVKCPAYYAIPKELRNMMIIDEEIRNNKEKRNWENAVEKWRKDIEYVNSIDISNLDKKIPDVLNVKKRIRI